MATNDERRRGIRARLSLEGDAAPESSTTNHKSADIADESVGDEPSFEQALGELEAIVTALEDGRLPLDEALALFERGVRLAQQSQRHLDRAELRVERLRPFAKAGNGDTTEGFLIEPFEVDGAE